MSETWTEYGVVFQSGHNEAASDLAEAQLVAKVYCGKVVGRTVTASDWLPVDGAR